MSGIADDFSNLCHFKDFYSPMIYVFAYTN